MPNLTRKHDTMFVWYVSVFNDASVVRKLNLGVNNLTYMVYKGLGLESILTILDRTCMHLYQVVIRMEQRNIMKCLQELSKLPVFTVALVEFIGLISSWL